MDTGFACAKYTTGQLNAMIKLLRKQGGSDDAPERFLRGELTVSPPVRAWREQDGIIRFSVTSDGTTGEGWITRLESKGNKVSPYAKQVLRSTAFQPTNGVTTEIAVMKGSLFTDDDRITSKIRAKAKEYQFQTPHAEVACLIREMFTDEEIKEMGLTWIVTMHEPIEDSDRYPYLLGTDRRGGSPWLDANDDEPGDGWNRDIGFAFAVPQVSPYR